MTIGNTKTTAFSNNPKYMYDYIPSSNLPIINGTTLEAQQENYDAIWNAISEHSCCIVRVIDDESILSEYATQVDELHQKLCQDKTTPNGSRSMGGILKRFGAGSHPYAVEWRLNPIVRSLFAVLYDSTSSDMTVSNDAVCILGEDAKRGPWSRNVHTKEAEFFRQTGGKLPGHVDVNPINGSPGSYIANDLKTRGKYFLQSSLSLLPVPAGGATFVYADIPMEEVYRPRTTSLYDAYNIKYGDYVTLKEDGYGMVDGKWRQVDNIPAGCLILFCGIHANKLADRTASTNKRAAIYICWLPRSFFNYEQWIWDTLKEKKMKALIEGKTMDHNPINYNFVSYGGSHYSNGKGRTKVIYGTSENQSRPVYDESLYARILQAL